MTYESTTEGISVVGGVEVDITVRGDEQKSQKVLMDLKERTGRLGKAFAEETPPSELPDDLGQEYTPIATVAWERVFEEDDDDE